MMVGTGSAGCGLPASQSGLVFLCMRLFVLFQILRPLERLLANLTIMRFQRYVHSKMASNMVSLDSDNRAAAPVASKAQVVGGFATDMVVGEMDIELLRIVVSLGTTTPSTLNVVSHRFFK